MPYATVIDVLNRAPYRGAYTATSIPTATQVVGYLQDGYAELNLWLYSAGYDAPFDSYIASGMVATTALLLLRDWNSCAAAKRVEEGSMQSDRLPLFTAELKRIKNHIEDKERDLPLPVLASKQMPRSPVGLNTSGASQPMQGISAVDVSPRAGINGGEGFVRGSWDL